jgi:predicted Fe-S protein YdhL (DUF1289 family)
LEGVATAEDGWAQARRELEHAEAQFLKTESAFRRRLDEDDELSAKTAVEIDRELQGLRPRLRWIKSTIAAHTAAEPPVSLVCAECGRTADETAFDWPLYFTSDEPREIAVHCPECAGGGKRSSTAEMPKPA